MALLGLSPLAAGGGQPQRTPEFTQRKRFAAQEGLRPKEARHERDHAPPNQHQQGCAHGVCFLAGMGRMDVSIYSERDHTILIPLDFQESIFPAS